MCTAEVAREFLLTTGLESVVPRHSDELLIVIGGRPHLLEGYH